MAESAPAPTALVDGRPAESLPVDDRGLLYGDGLFETMAFTAGHCALWPWHMERLERGAARLKIELPAKSLLLKESRALAKEDACVIRLTVTRGSSRRPGYAASGLEQTRRLIVRLARPAPRNALRIGVCRERLPTPGLTAGLKHLSRLDQVLLAQEITDAGWDEGLVFDQQDHLCEGLQSNVLLLPEEHSDWLTPPVGAGVEGACRAALLQHALVREAPLGERDLERCTSLALCNAVRGVEPVSELVEVKVLSPQPAEALAARLKSALRRHNAPGEVTRSS